MTIDSVMDFYPTRKSNSFSLIERQEPVVYDDVLDLQMLGPENVRFFNDNGYLLIPNLFSRNEVNALSDELVRLSVDEKEKCSERYILEPHSGDVRSIFYVHKTSPVFKNLSYDHRIVNVIRQLLGSDVYITQSRINLKPGFEGKEFYWHSDFETWHSEDGMPNMRAISCSINLTDNYDFNGPLMVIPGSHKSFVSCGGQTPDDHFKESLKRQEVGTPSKEILERLSDEEGIVSLKGAAGSVLFFDCNLLHASSGNITPFPRSNVFFVYNSTENQLIDPFCGKKPRPEYIASRKVDTINPTRDFQNSFSLDKM